MWKSSWGELQSGWQAARWSPQPIPHSRIWGRGKGREDIVIRQALSGENHLSPFKDEINPDGFNTFDFACDLARLIDSLLKINQTAHPQLSSVVYGDLLRNTVNMVPVLRAFAQLD